MSRIEAIAKVQLTVEITLDQPWGDDCAIGQLYRQAGESALKHFSNQVIKGCVGVKVVGEPKIIGIITEQK